MTAALSDLQVPNPSPRPTVGHLLTRLVMMILLPLLAFSAFLLWRYTEQQQELTQLAAASAATQLANDLDRDIHGIMTTLAVLATSPSLQTDDLGAFEIQARRVAALIEAPILLKDAATGAQRMNTRLQPGEPLPSLPLSAWDRKIIEASAPYVSDVVTGQVTGRPLVAVSVPVLKANRVIAILTASFDPSRIEVLLANRPHAPNWSTAVTDRRGVFIAKSGVDAVMGQQSGFAFDHAKGPGVERAVDAQGTLVVRAFSKTQHGWTAAASTPVSFVEAPLRSSWLGFVALGTASLGLALALAIRLARFIADAVTAVAASAGALERGDVVNLHSTGMTQTDSVMGALHHTSIALRDRTRSIAEYAARLKSMLETAQVEAAARTKLAALVLASSDAMLSVSGEAIIEASNPGTAHLLGAGTANLIGQPLAALFPADKLCEIEPLLQRAWRGEAVHAETVVQRAGGQSLDVALSASPIRAPDDTVTGLAVTLEDIGQRKQWESQLLMLNRELQHRIKNSLAVVQSIANQTLRSSATLQDFRQAFQGRLQALAGANDLLLQSTWTGDDLRQLIEKQVELFLINPETQLTLSGETVSVPAELTVPLSLAFHELGTNALKFGAWAVPGGRVRLDWRVDQAGPRRKLHISWRETGGPAARQPARKGFGSTLILRGIPGGSVTQEFAPDGLACEINVVLPDLPAAAMAIST